MNSLQANELMPVCWVIGPNVPTSAVEHLRSLGLQVEVADEIPDGAQWFVPSTLLCSRDFEPAVFRRWRPTASFEWTLWASGRLSHYCDDRWSNETAGRTVSAFNQCALAIKSGSPCADPFEQPLEEQPGVAPPPAVLLLTKDWEEADYLLEMAVKANLSEVILASPNVHDLAELAGRYGQLATLITPSRVVDQPLPWVESDPQTLTLASIDFQNPQAFSNAVGHSIWLLVNELEDHRRRMPTKRKAWGHIQNFHPLQDQIRVGLFFADSKDAQLGQELVSHRSEMAVFSWDPEAFSKFIILMNPTAIFFDRRLVHFPEHPELSLQENSELFARINISLSFSKTRLGLLPSGWKATGLEPIFQDLSTQSDEDPSQVQRIFALLQLALKTTEKCRFQFHLDGGWTVEADGATLQWSPSRQLLRLYTQGKTTRVSWNSRISSDITPSGLYFCTYFPQGPEKGDLAVSVHQTFEAHTAAPNLLTYSRPVA